MALVRLAQGGDAFARILTGRALHRAEWRKDGIALGVALITGAVTLRIASNVFMAVDIATRGGVVQIWQFAVAHTIVLAAISSWTAIRRVAVVAVAGSAAPFLSRNRSGHRFLRACRARALYAQAGFLLPVAAGLLLSVTAAIVSSQPAELLWAVPLYLLCAALLPAIIAAASLRLGLPEESFEILQLLGLLLVLAANPDIVPGNSGVVVVLFNRVVPLDPGVVAGLTAGAASSPLIAGLTLWAYVRFGRLVTNRVPTNALMLWYRRLTFGPWIVLFGLMTPVTFTENLAPSGRRWISFVVAVIAVAWLVGVVGRMDQVLEFRLNRPLARRRHARLLAPVVATHLLFAAIATIPALLR